MKNPMELKKSDVKKIKAGTWIEISWIDSANEIGLLLEPIRDGSSTQYLCFDNPDKPKIKTLDSWEQVVRIGKSVTPKI